MYIKRAKHLSNRQSNGRGLEHAFGLALEGCLGVRVSGDIKALRKKAYEHIDPECREVFSKDALSLLVHILQLEGIPLLESGWSARYLGDAAARDGDVRDIVISKGNREVGISCKSNHKAFKHSRISPESSLRVAWRLSPLSDSDRRYVRELGRLFDDLESRPFDEWSDLDARRKQAFYDACIAAFNKEIQRLIGEIGDSEISRGLVRYFLGSKGYYKCVVSERGSFLQAFCFGRCAVARISFPKRLVALDFPPGRHGVLHMHFDRGFSFSLRLHNASSNYERSLKFDIQALALPQSLYTHHLSRELRR